MPPILIIGATGTVGREVVSQLASLAIPVRAFVRNPQTANLPPQVEIITGDLTKPDSLEPALAGIDTVFLVWTAPPAAFATALDRIARHARRIVFLSAPLKTPHPLYQQQNMLRTLTEQFEQRIEASGLEWTFLRPGMFAANALNWWAPQIRANTSNRVSGFVLANPELTIVRWPYLDVPTAPIHEHDIAAVATRALTENGHHRAEYVLTGPESLTQREQIATIAQALGRRILIEELSPDEARRVGLPSVPKGAENMLLNAWAAAAGQPAWITSTVEQLTGSPARTFRQWVADHLPAFQSPST